MANAITVDRISKRYWLGGRSRAGSWFSKDDFWALRDVSFDVKENDAVGIIGANGAGKSTLLKILSRVVAPTSGRAQIRGRMGTILEVGTGFHPEMTGRENIYLSGAILGMTQTEIRRKFYEIVEFSGVESHVDTPVKRYSSGMYVRLAFAVAAHLEPDILIVDEVLAVGDVGFQKKCLTKMDDSVHKQGRTVIFVSHNMQAVRALCSRAILLDKGTVVADGPLEEVLPQYSSKQSSSINTATIALGNRLDRTRGRVRIASFEVVGNVGRWTFESRAPFHVRITYEVFERIESLAVLIAFSSATDGSVVTTLKGRAHQQAMGPGQRGVIDVAVRSLAMRPGEFLMSVGIGDGDFSTFEDILDANVDMPHLIVKSEEKDVFLRSGVLDLEYEISHRSLTPAA